MNPNRKIRPQPSLASLTTDEYHQLAEMVCTRTYDDVRQQINRPRSQGGFDLNISIKPLQVLHARVHRLNKVNEQLATGKKLTLTAYDEIHAGEHRAPEEIHHAILDATYILATEHDNTPHHLLALQRLADFPARAEIREAKELRAQAAADRAEEIHTHKITMELRKEAHKVQMDLRKFAHKLDMDTFRNQLALTRISSNDRWGKANRESDSAHIRTGVAEPTSISRDARIPTNATPADPNPVHPSHPGNPVKKVEDNSDRPKIRILVDEDGKPFTRFPTPNPLPHDIYLKNCAYTKKLLAGLVDPVTGEELDAPSSNGDTVLNFEDKLNG